MPCRSASYDASVGTSFTSSFSFFIECLTAVGPHFPFLLSSRALSAEKDLAGCRRPPISVRYTIPLTLATTTPKQHHQQTKY
eukprot:scaffold3072_cov81-Skeletonema_dohrnii-CCMP3373.AAC.3